MCLPDRVSRNKGKIRVTAFSGKGKTLETTEFQGLLVARGNNSNPLRLFAILLEKYPIDRLAGGAFAL